MYFKIASTNRIFKKYCEVKYASQRDMQYFCEFQQSTFRSGFKLCKSQQWNMFVVNTCGDVYNKYVDHLYYIYIYNLFPDD